jgi:hypothetical protein
MTQGPSPYAGRTRTVKGWRKGSMAPRAPTIITALDAPDAGAEGERPAW